MKKFPLVLVTLVVMATCLMHCGPEKDRVCFSGKVVDNKGNPVVGALVSFGGRKTKATETSKNGSFEICIERGDRYVLNITKLGFGLVSKILMDTVGNASTNVEVMMTTATIEEIEPEEQDEVVVVQDITPTTSEPPSATVPENSVRSPLDTIPFVYDGNGQLVAFQASPAIGGSYQAAQAFEEQIIGASVEVNPQDLEEDPSGAAAGFMQVENDSKKGAITASLSTIDIYNPDGMPGDYTVRNIDGCANYMQTFGAADINFYREGKRLQLKKGTFAKLTIPVDTIVLLASGTRIPRTIPLFVYDKETGEWRRDGNNVGVLNKERTAYVAKLSHFSVYNMDIEFGSPACYRMCNSATVGNIPTTYYMEITGPMGNFHTYPFQAGCTDGCGTGINAHVIARMRQDQETGVRIFDGPPPTGKIKSSYVFIAGATSPDVYGTFCSADNGLCSGGATATISDWTSAPSRPPYMDPVDDGTMIKPIIALKVVNTGGVDRIRISWVFIPDVTIAGPNRDYTTLTNQSYFLEWSNDPTFGSVSGTIAITPNTNWLNFFDFNMSSITGPSGDAYKFRIRVGPAIDAINSDPSDVCVTPDDGYLLTGC
jgi:hypothetical protein